MPGEAVDFCGQSASDGVASTLEASGVRVLDSELGDGGAIGPEWERPKQPSGLAGLSSCLRETVSIAAGALMACRIILFMSRFLRIDGASTDTEVVPTEMAYRNLL